MTTTDLQKRIEESPALSRLREQLTAELSAESGGAATFSLLLAITVISIIVQVIIHCREQQSEAELLASVKQATKLPPRKRMRLKRRLNQLWRDECLRSGQEPTRDNPLLAAVYRVADKLDETAAQELVNLAR
jgi:hypothetical protein